MDAEGRPAEIRDTAFRRDPVPLAPVMMHALFVFVVALSGFQVPAPDPGPPAEDEQTICFPYIGCFEI